MRFGEALDAMIDEDKKVCRSGWNGKGMYIYLRRFDGQDPCLAMFTAQGTHQPGWLASQADMLAYDWEVK